VVKKDAIVFDFNGQAIAFDSPEELWFAWWLEELREAGVIKGWSYHPPGWDVARSCFLRWQEQGKRNILDKERCLFREHTYTADFSLQWANHDFVNYAKPPDKPGWNNNGLYMVKSPLDPVETEMGGRPKENAVMITTNFAATCYIDVKGAFTRMHEQDAKFRLIRGVIWEKYGEYINRVVPHTGSKKKPDCLFRDTFVPHRFLFTDKTAKMRAIPYPVKTLGQWLLSVGGKMMYQRYYKEDPS